ncbi:UNVERIFIED_CONTAM: hypothetical protein NCL1_47209 [Trichonephila clavipes]
MCPCGVVPPPSSTYPRGLSRSPPRSLPEPLDAKLPITDFCLPRPTATNCPPPRTAPAKNGQQAGGQCPSSLWTLALGRGVLSFLCAPVAPRAISSLLSSRSEAPGLVFRICKFHPSLLSCLYTHTTASKRIKPPCHSDTGLYLKSFPKINVVVRFLLARPSRVCFPF